MKKNIVLFMVDQLSQKWLDAAFDGICELPNIKSLVDNGTMCSNYFSSNPVCCPTRATMATGLTTRGHGVLENGYSLNPQLPTFMHSLKKNGYRTGAFGKVHLRPHFEGFWPDYKQYGFDETHITEDGRGGEWLDWVKENHPEHFDSVLTTIWASHIPEFEEYGEGKEDLKKRINKLRSKAKWETDNFPENMENSTTLPFPKELSQTEWITMYAVNYIKECKNNTPFFAQISYVQPHSPFTPPADFMKDVNVENIPRPVPSEWKIDPHAPEYFSKLKLGKYVNNDMYARHCYFADLVHLDHQLGIILDTLKENDVYDDTYILFISDHGELLGDHGFYGKEERHYDACIRSPFIISGPGLPKGRICTEFIQPEDFCPTILDLSDSLPELMPEMGNYLNIKKEDIPIFPGKSILNLCRADAEPSWRKEAYIESYNPIWSMDVGDWARTIRTEKYRYTYYADKNGEQLFNLIDDPDEQHNLIAEPQYQDIKTELKDRLFECIIKQDYPKTRRELFAFGVH
ncbi:DUF4976 domain-containing protein [Oceanispirochaeta crateris]|uniref:DUF4976 domain-containing protein n=1 Tax=Oceanispirochaeta crateris TaxID=2518645 RepID=A0A5C1QP17_9SPIO|nr:sulfatase-like hydrolase/transferase [Oceanispirochaeta crateris]QEN08304.1 DUF4976 domain-containing protein [Oceanispirochaeta crateris]